MIRLWKIYIFFLEILNYIFMKQKFEFSKLLNYVNREVYNEGGSTWMRNNNELEYLRMVLVELNVLNNVWMEQQQLEQNPIELTVWYWNSWFLCEENSKIPIEHRLHLVISFDFCLFYDSVLFFFLSAEIGQWAIEWIQWFFLLKIYIFYLYSKSKWIQNVI